MAEPARQQGEKRPARPRPAPLVYTVEDAPAEPDPEAARKVLAWLRARLG